MNSEIHYAMPASEYHAAHRINYSGLKTIINKSPAHYRYGLTNSPEETAALKFGSAVHTAVLENPFFFHIYAIAPAIDRRTKEGKAEFAKLEAGGKIILSNEEGEQVLKIAQAVNWNETAFKLLRNGKSEVTIFAEIDDIPAKCRVDYLRPGVAVDLKTTDDASPSGFASACAKYDYAMQAAWYLDSCAAAGIELDAFIFVAVEKKPPYAVGIYELDLNSIEAGRTKYRRALSLYKHCMAVDEWPAYSPDIVTISLPAWAMKEVA